MPNQSRSGGTDRSNRLGKITSLPGATVTPSKASNTVSDGAYAPVSQFGSPTSNLGPNGTLAYPTNALANPYQSPGLMPNMIAPESAVDPSGAAMLELFLQLLQGFQGGGQNILDMLLGGGASTNPIQKTSINGITGGRNY